MIKKNPKLKKFSLLFTILALPASIYFLLSLGTHHYKPLPILGKKSIQQNTQGGIDTIYHTISNFSLLDQDSQLVSLDNTKNKIIIANFFFATCPNVCPKIITNMSYINNRFLDINDKIQLLSFTVNPEHDTPTVLKEYAKKAHLNQENWRLITGDKKVIYNLAVNSFLVPAKNINNDFIHSEFLVLIDKQKRIRGFFNGTIHKEIKQNMADAIDILLKEDFVPLKRNKKTTI